jgi:hypothetical protein
MLCESCSWMGGSRTSEIARRISLGDPSRKTSSWKTEEEKDFKNFDSSVRWWMELIGDRVKWRTFLISIHSRRDE